MPDIKKPKQDAVLAHSPVNLSNAEKAAEGRDNNTAIGDDNNTAIFEGRDNITAIVESRDNNTAIVESRDNNTAIVSPKSPRALRRMLKEESAVVLQSVIRGRSRLRRFLENEAKKKNAEQDKKQKIKHIQAYVINKWTSKIRSKR